MTFFVMLQMFLGGERVSEEAIIQRMSQKASMLA